MNPSRIGYFLKPNIAGATCVRYALRVLAVIFPDFKASSTSGRKFYGRGNGSESGGSICFMVFSYFDVSAITASPQSPPAPPLSVELTEVDFHFNDMGWHSFCALINLTKHNEVLRHTF